MAAWRVTVALALVLSSATASADPDDLPPVEIDDLGGVAGAALSMRAGVATAPLASTSLGEAKGQAIVGVLSAFTAIAHPLWIGVQLPLVGASVAQPANSYLDDAAWGTPRAFATMQWDQR